MESLLRHIKNAFLKKSQVSIDNIVSKLHYRVTCQAMLSVSIFISSKMLCSDSIMCTQDKLPIRFVEQYCQTQTTFSYDGTNKRHHWEYPWVALVLFLQAAAFYIPRFLWKFTENGCVSKLIQDLNNPVLCQEMQGSQMVNIKNYWKQNRGSHTKLPIMFFFCETLNLANIISQIFVTNWFLGGLFFTYGSSVVQFWLSSSLDNPMDEVFPTTTKCTISSFATTGQVLNTDILCLLPLNVVHRHLYLIIWMWYCLLTIVTALNTILILPILISQKVTVMAMTGFQNGSTNMNKLHNFFCNKQQTFFENLGDAFMLKLLLQNLTNNKLKQDLIVNVCIESPNFSSYKTAQCHQFQKGDLVTIKKKMTWPLKKTIYNKNQRVFQIITIKDNVTAVVQLLHSIQKPIVVKLENLKMFRKKKLNLSQRTFESPFDGKPKEESDTESINSLLTSTENHFPRIKAEGAQLNPNYILTKREELPQQTEEGIHSCNSSQHANYVELQTNSSTADLPFLSDSDSLSTEEGMSLKSANTAFTNQRVYTKAAKKAGKIFKHPLASFRSKKTGPLSDTCSDHPNKLNSAKVGASSIELNYVLPIANQKRVEIEYKVPQLGCSKFPPGVAQSGFIQTTNQTKNLPLGAVAVPFTTRVLKAGETARQSEGNIIREEVTRTKVAVEAKKLLKEQIGAKILSVQEKE